MIEHGIAGGFREYRGRVDRRFRIADRLLRAEIHLDQVGRFAGRRRALGHDRDDRLTDRAKLAPSQHRAVGRIDVSEERVDPGPR